MQPRQVREMFEKVLPREMIEQDVAELCVQERRRHLDPVNLVMSLVLAGGTPEAGRISEVMKEYCRNGGKRVVAGSYVRWFNDRLLAVMLRVVDRMKAYVHAMPLHLPGILAGRRDWRVVDSTTVRVPRELLDVYPGAGDYAALKVHKELSLGCENVVDYHITPARDQDGPHLVVDESRRGTGLIVDLGYVSHGLIRRAHEYDVHLVIRLKEGWKLFADSSAMTSDILDWNASEEVLLSLDGQPLHLPLREHVDIDVVMGPNRDIGARLVVIETPEGWASYLTTVPRDTHSAEEIGMLYRLRWGVELQNKLAKSCCQLDQITAKKEVSAQILVHAAMVSSMLANALAHLEHVDQGMTGNKGKRPIRPPVHAMSIWRSVRVHASDVVRLLMAPGQPDSAWTLAARNFMYDGQDPNWKRKPSPIDQVKGRVPSGRPWRSRGRRGG